MNLIKKQNALLFSSLTPAQKAKYDSLWEYEVELFGEFLKGNYTDELAEDLSRNKILKMVKKSK